MIRQQHQRAADQIGGVLVGPAPMPWRSADAAVRADDVPFSIVATTSRRMRPPTIARPSAARVNARGSALAASASTAMVRSIGAASARGLGDRAHFGRHQRAIVARKRIDAGHIPQQRRGMFERVGLRKIDAVHAAIDRAVLGDGRNRRIHHRQIGVEAFAGRAAPATARAVP